MTPPPALYCVSAYDRTREPSVVAIDRYRSSCSTSYIAFDHAPRLVRSLDQAIYQFKPRASEDRRGFPLNLTSRWCANPLSHVPALSRFAPFPRTSPSAVPHCLILEDPSKPSAIRLELGPFCPANTPAHSILHGTVAIVIAPLIPA